MHGTGDTEGMTPEEQSNVASLLLDHANMKLRCEEAESRRVLLEMRLASATGKLFEVLDGAATLCQDIAKEYQKKAARAVAENKPNGTVCEAVGGKMAAEDCSEAIRRWRLELLRKAGEK
jgi:hypothetical protein